jgi:hypothetical protein
MEKARQTMRAVALAVTCLVIGTMFGTFIGAGSAQARSFEDPMVQVAKHLGEISQTLKEIRKEMKK